jgi:hypothetical protein
MLRILLVGVSGVCNQITVLVGCKVDFSLFLVRLAFFSKIGPFSQIVAHIAAQEGHAFVLIPSFH